MASTTGKKVKGKGVAKLVKAFLKRKSGQAKSAIKKAVRKARPAAKKAPAPKAVPQKKVASRKSAPHVQAPVKKKTPAPRPAAPAARKATLPPPTPVSFINGKSRIAGPKYFFQSDIPDVYNDTYMRAIPRDPEWIFVYWEISEATRNDLKSKMGAAAYESSKKLLRLCDVTDISYNGSNAQRYTDIEVTEYASNWYVRVPEPARTYVIECGFLTAEGRFFLAVRSNTVAVPRFGLSAAQDQEWTTANSDEIIRMSADGFKRGLGASEQRFGALAERGGADFGLASGSGSGGMFDMPSSKI